MRETLDFIVIGAGKSASSSLFEHLRAHPELYIPPQKEYPFFSRDDVYENGWSAYMWNAFRGAPSAARWGTVTPQYMAGCPMRVGEGQVKGWLSAEPTEEIIPTRIHAQLPGVKLIAILREPVERCISAYGMDIFLGKADRRRFDRTIDELLSSSGLESARHQRAPTHVTAGEYGRILRGYYDVFPREQILVCFTSDLERSSRALMAELFGYLRVDRDFVPGSLDKRYRQGATAERIGWLPSPWKLEKALARQRWARTLWHRLPAAVQSGALMRSRRVNYRVLLWNQGGRPFDRRDASPATLQRLHAHYERDRLLLEEVIGKPVPWGGPQHESVSSGVSRERS
jgi:hypothetical protein